MRVGLLVALAVILFVLQISFVPALRPLGVVPNLGLVIVAVAGLYGTASLALGLAVTGGLLMDLVSGSNFGLYVGLLVVVALAAGFIHRAGLHAGGPLAAIGLVTLATVVQDMLVLGESAGLVARWPWGAIVQTLGLELALNVLAVLILVPVVRFILPKGDVEFEVRG